MKPIQTLPRVTVDGVMADEALPLSGLRIVQCLDAPSQCEVIWTASTLSVAVMDDATLAPGQTITVRIDGQPSAVFQGEITSIEHLHDPAGGFSLRVRAYDKLARLQRRQTLQTQVDTTTAELARTLAGEAGITVNAEQDGPVWPRIVPHFAHDLALLRDYTARSDLHFIYHDDTLRLFNPGEPEHRPLSLTLGEDLLETRLEQNGVQPLSRVRVQGWDPHTGESREAQYQHHSPLQPGVDDNWLTERTLLGATVESDAEAEALASAALHRNQAQSACLWGIAEGQIALHPGRWLQVQGVATGMTGPYLLTRVIHSVDAERGYTCELNTRPEPRDPPPRDAPGLVLGEVCDVNDQEEQGRAQVMLDMFGEAVSTWLRIMQLGAGADKGLVALPEVGDLVVVALPDGDPSRGIVLGGIYRQDGPPRHPDSRRRDDANRPYTLTTRRGQRLELNDADNSLRLEDSAGNFLSLTPEGVTLHAEGQLVIEAPGERLILRGDRIDMERR